MRPLLVLRVFGRPPDLHQQGQHRMARATVTRERRAMVKVLAQGERHRVRLAPAKPLALYYGAGKRRLHITIWWRGTKRDDPNMLQDLKADIDGLKDAGWLVDDSREWMVLDYPPEYVLAMTEKDVSVEYRLYEAEA
jgi:hypothetical protein